MKILVSDVEINLDSVAMITYIIKTIFIGLCTYYTFLKFSNIKNKVGIKTFFTYVGIFVASIIVSVIKDNSTSFMGIMVLTFLLALINSIDTHTNIGYSILITVIALSFNYIIFVIAIMINFSFNFMVTIKNDFLNLLLIMIFHVCILKVVFKVRRIKNGIIFLQRNSNNENFDILMLNISIILLFSTIILSNINISISKNLFIGFVIFVIIMFITIQKSLQLYYKQKLLIQDLTETKEELEKTKSELKQVEEENLGLSKKSHSIAHKQKALEYKMQQLLTNTEISTEEAGKVQDRIKEIQKDLYKDKVTMELSKTGISKIDDMLEYMQSECVKNKIEFELQISGNIYYMVNNLISKEDLEILLADHIKDAIIAINHTDNINRSILVRLGEIEGIYSLYIYDSGIEFEKETLSKLGKKPITTHANEGGTGMGFMNTFDTLKKYKASLTINELNEPNKDNYTKVLMFKFDKKNEFNVISYKQ